MVFSKDFGAISGGRVRVFTPTGTEEAPILFGRQLKYKRHLEEREDLIVLLRSLEGEGER